jgi:putative aldouronate transport system permease protein
MGPAGKVINYLMLLLLFVTMVIPMINVLAVSFSTKLGSMEPGLKLWPDSFTFEGYVDIWSRAKLWLPFFNSLYVTGVATVCQVVLSSMAGYVLIQRELPFKKFMTTIIMITIG